MLKKRKDGQLVKMDPLFKIIPLVMEERSDAQVWLNEEISTGPIDDYIRKKQAQGINLSYMHIFYAALIRTIKEKPQLNQFVMRGRLYRRNAITISLAIKRDMTDEGEETLVKIDFTGNESPEEIKNMLNSIIAKEKSGTGESNDIDSMLGILDKIPHFILRYAVKFIKYLDTINFMPNSIIKLSPFHTSAFITNMGSLGIDAINHHIYNFGTVGIFLAIGKKSRRVVVRRGEFVEDRTISVGFVTDERICDGFYYASALKLFFKLLRRPELLDESSDVEETFSSEE